MQYQTRSVFLFFFLYVSVIALAKAEVSPSVGVNLEANSGNSVEPEVNREANDKNSKSKYEPEFVAVPFIFSTETLSTTVGGAGVMKHAGQPQASVLGIGLYSSNDSWVSYLGVNSYQLPKLDQWLFSGEFYRANYKQGIYFVPDETTGDIRDSDKSGVPTSRVVTVGDESYSKLHMKYVVPWGKGANGAARSMMPSRNSDDHSWDPRQSGVTSIEITPFVQTQELVGYEYLPSKAQGIELKLDWDNRDNGKNSTRGGQTSLTVSRDFGARSSNPEDQRESWTTWEFEQSAFFSLGGSDWFPQQILAFNFYLADTPTWNDYDVSSEKYQRPPSFSGVSLGGFEHLRGYSSKQFVGRSAVLYSAEYRVQPQWQPLQTLPVFNLYDLPWWQWVVFAEAGQVADNFSASELHDDMKWTIGLGARFEVESVVVRAELAYGEDSNQFWVMVNQPF